MKISTLVFLALAILSAISVEDACTPPTPSPDISSIITKDLFEEMLKHRDDESCAGKGFYTYDAFIAAARSFNGFGTTGDDDTRKRELAAFFAHTSYRTSGGGQESEDGEYAWGYCIVREPGNHPPTCCTSPDWPCAPYKSYHARGPLQLKHNHNYGKTGKGIGVDLINNPDLVETDPIISFKTAIWFWMTAQDNKPSPHDVMVGKWTPSDEDVSAGRLQGFGVVTNIFNSWACGKGPNEGVDDPIGFYKRHSDILGVGYGENIDCYCQKPYA